MSQSSEELFGKPHERLAGGVSHEPFQGSLPEVYRARRGFAEV